MPKQNPRKPQGCYETLKDYFLEDQLSWFTGIFWTGITGCLLMVRVSVRFRVEVDILFINLILNVKTFIMLHSNLFNLFINLNFLNTIQLVILVISVAFSFQVKREYKLQRLRSSDFEFHSKPSHHSSVRSHLILNSPPQQPTTLDQSLSFRQTAPNQYMYSMA